MELANESYFPSFSFSLHTRIFILEVFKQRYPYVVEEDSSSLIGLDNTCYSNLGLYMEYIEHLALKEHNNYFMVQLYLVTYITK